MGCSIEVALARKIYDGIKHKSKYMCTRHYIDAVRDVVFNSKILIQRHCYRQDSSARKSNVHLVVFQKMVSDMYGVT